MIEREKVINGLKCCLPSHDPDCDLCPYDSIDLRCRVKLYNDIMALLKAQKPVKPKIGGDVDGASKSWWYTCGTCNEQVGNGDKFCRWCGRMVEWE